MLSLTYAFAYYDTCCGVVVIINSFKSVKYLEIRIYCVFICFACGMIPFCVHWQAKEAGSTRFCMGAAWRETIGRKTNFNQILEYVKEIR